MTASDRQRRLTTRSSAQTIAAAFKATVATKSVAARAIKRLGMRRFLSQNGDFSSHLWVE